jgi:hypothetical protein
LRDFFGVSPEIGQNKVKSGSLTVHNPALAKTIYLRNSLNLEVR